MRFGLLGPLHVVDDDSQVVDLGGRQPRLLVAMLLVASGRAVTIDAITDAIWGDDLPTSATGTLQSYVSRLRRRLGDAASLRWDDAGYRLDVPADRVDFRHFESLADQARVHLDAGRLPEAIRLLEEADALWRGPALLEFPDHEFATGIAARLEERRLNAAEDRMAAELQLGRHAAIVGELAALVAANPLRESLQERYALALYRSGRQAEALRSLSDAARTLRDEFGIEPSRPLRELETAILTHDPALDLRTDRGDDGRVRISRVEAQTHAPADAEPRSPASPARADRLVGRDPELGQLLGALDEAATSARFVVIEGEPGIGKTRLAEELRTIAMARGAQVHWGRTDEGGAAPALWPWLSPLREIAQRVGTVPAALTELLAGEVPLAPGRAVDTQFERFEAVAALLEGAAATAPVIVVLDDLQWADGTSLDLVRFLATRLSSGVLVAATMRQLEVGRNDAVTDALAAVARRPGSRRIHLRGLSEDATAAMLDSTMQRAPSAATAAHIHSRAEGNPFYAIELARLLDEERGQQGSQHGDQTTEVPAGVGAVVRRRIGRLPAATIDLLGVAAVTGRDVEVGLLTRSAELTTDLCLDALEPAVVHRLLVEVPDQPSVFRFSHALVREVLLEDLSSLRQARLHLKVADAMQAGGAGVDDVEILAEHLWRAAPVGVGARAAEALERAADVAVRRVAYAAAEDLLNKAVQLRRTTGSTSEDHEAELGAIWKLLEVGRARRYFQGAASQSLIDRAKDLAERCGHRQRLFDVLWFEWSALATSCRRSEAEPLAAAYVALTRDDPDPEVRSMGHEVQGVCHWTAGRISDAVAELDLALGLLDGLPEPLDGFGAEKRMIARVFWLFNHAAHGDLPADEVFARFDDLVGAMPDRFAVASVCGFAATTALALGRWHDVERFAAIGLDADPGSQFAFWGGQALMQRGVVEAWRGRVDDALQSFAEGKSRYLEIGGRSALSSFEASLAMHLTTAGRIDEATAAVDAARAELETYDERWNEPIVLMAEADVAFARGDSDGGRDRQHRAAALAHAQGAHALAWRADALSAPQ